MPFDTTSTGEIVAKALASEIKGKTGEFPSSFPEDSVLILITSAVIVTGVSPGGYGAETARVLALVGAKVVLAGRSLSKYVFTFDY